MSLLCGWDFSGNFPAAVVVQRVAPMQYQVLKEFYNDRMQAIDFAKWVLEEMAMLYPGYEGIHYAGPGILGAVFKFKRRVHFECADGAGELRNRDDAKQAGA